MKLRNGEFVTKRFAPPTLALSALALENAGITPPGGLDAGMLRQAQIQLYEQRGSGLLIRATHIDELTSSNGPLAAQLKQNKGVIDPAINALFVMNGWALEQFTLKTKYDHQAGRYGDINRQTENELSNYLDRLSDTASLSNEVVLAAARMGYTDMLKERDLEEFFAPAESDSHPEKTKLSMAECIEVARLVPTFEASRTYLRRILPKIAQLGTITRFEDITPSKNDLANKIGRKQSWLPTAAQIVQIDPNSI
jgi:hypothetical protein